MKTTAHQHVVLRGVMALGLGAAALLTWPATARATPDVIVGDLPTIRNWGAVGSKSGYTIGTTSCNIGDTDAIWQPLEPNHPVIGQNLYRLKDGRFEQIALSWLKHAGSTINGTLCGTCQPPPGSYFLGVGCSDPYDSTLNGDQFRMGPRSEVNPFTGVYPYPYVLQNGQTGDALFKRLQVAHADIDPALNASAVYVAEAQYITADEAAFGTQMNNVSWRRFTVGAPQSGAWALNFSSMQQTVRQQPAIAAWASIDPGVVIRQVDVAGDGRLYVGYRVYAEAGQYRYEYAIANMNSDRGAGSFFVPVPAGAGVSGVGFKDIEYHSGEPYAGTDWTNTTSGGVLWQTESAAMNANANAHRWGTLYNYWFISSRPPVDVQATIGLWKPGAPSSVSVIVAAPSPPTCPGDANGDGITNGADLSVFLSAFGTMAGEPGFAAGADYNGDGVINGSDLSVLLSNFGCPG